MLIGPTKRLDIPHEPGEWIEIRPLSWRQAVEVRQLDDEMAITLAVLKAGIAAWSYPEAVTEETIDRLDAGTATFVIGALTPGSSEADRKNGSESSAAQPVAMASGRKRGS